MRLIAHTIGVGVRVRPRKGREAKQAFAGPERGASRPRLRLTTWELNE
jgi:hypothetical protein